MRPRDVLALRRVLLNDCQQSRTGMTAMDSVKTPMMEIASGVREALTSAPAYYVTDDMAAVARAAARTMPNQPLLLSDLPSEDGFMLFGGPVAHLVDGAGERVPIIGCVWATEHYRDCLVWAEGAPPMITVDEWRTWPDCIDNDGSLIEDPPTGLVSGTDVAIYPLVMMPGHFRLMPVAYVSWEVGNEPDPVKVSDTGNDEADWHGGAANDDFSLARPLLAVWTLMQQSLTVSVPKQHSPTDAKRDRRLALPTELVVVRLRRVSTMPDDAKPDAEAVGWSHRWLVGGHWRNQWLPSRNAHRLQWIAPYLKGPDSMPLVVKERVTVWMR